MDRPDFNGKGKQLCKMGCGWRSVSGLAKGQGMCPYHWAESQWGRDWAQQCYPQYQARYDTPNK